VKPVFADTFYWIALTDSTDAAYERAQQITNDIVTTDEVLTEYLTFFCAAPEYIRREVAMAVDDILQNPTVHVIPQSRASFLAGLKLYRDRPDKGYSLTDCISMETMRREGLTDVLTNDRHFEQEGFRALFRGVR
jgi:predicted nucleic acid-binding protein